MLRLVRLSARWFGSGPQRRQNFFELNPIYPEEGQKDFDIYNADYKHVLSSNLALSDETRYYNIKQKLTKEVYLRPILEKVYGQQKGEGEVDEETGFPIGIHENFDNFIEIFKREKKVGSNVIGEFEDLVMTLMRKFEAKSQIELIKIFRLNLANARKKEFKVGIRALIINSAFIRFIKDRKAQGLTPESLNMAHLDTFLNSEQKASKRQTNEISKEELEEVVFRESLFEIDAKILKLEEEIQAKALADGVYIPTFHPKFGEAISEKAQSNLDYDLNYSRGYSEMTTSNEALLSGSQTQDGQIQSKINKLFFAEVLKRIQAKKEIAPKEIVKLHDLPVNIRAKDRIINALLHKYKEHDLLVEPDLEDIYGQIDMALKKISVKVVPNFIENEKENRQSGSPSGSEVKERILTKDLLLWRKLDVEEIFQPEYYQEEDVNKVKIEEKEVAELSPSSVLELSLNKMPFSLYRHADLDNFNVFTKYRKRVYKDYLSDKVIDPEIQFRYFSLEQAQTGLKKIKKPEDVPDRFYGHAKRKTSEAEVFMVYGNGRVIINHEPIADYFGDVYHRGEALKPLIFTETAGKYDLEFTVVGGGVHSQSECMAMALTNALIMVNPKYERTLAGFGLVGIDDRRRQPKRIGLYSARVRPPYVRR